MISVTESPANVSTSADNIQSLTEGEQELIDKVAEIPATTWFELSHWAKETNNFHPWKRKLLFSVGTLIRRGQKPSIKQAVHAMDTYKSALEKGFVVRR